MTRPGSFLRLFTGLAALAVLIAGSACGRAVRYIANTGDRATGITYYLGGAGPIGNVGSLDVPNGLGDAGYDARVEVFPWQGLTHAGDQINVSRNREKGAELASEIRSYRRAYPNNKINIIALSAGTGVATWALEYLPEGVQVDQVVYLGCSMSSRYDLTRALRRIEGKMYVLYSANDPILSKVLWDTGTGDRASAEEGVAGLRGFRRPPVLGPDTEREYSKVYNVPWRIDFADAGFDGGHIDCTSREFVREYIAPAIMGNDAPLIGRRGQYAESPFGMPRQAATQPAAVHVDSADRSIP